MVGHEIEVARTSLFKAKWPADIHREWIEALLRNEPQRDRAALERTCDLTDRAVRDCLVTGYEFLLPMIMLPDAGDRHVLAAAIAGGCEVIAMQNLKDFPAGALAAHGTEAQHPDEFLSNHLSLAPGLFCEAVRRVRALLKHPPYSVDDYPGTLTQQGLVATAGSSSLSQQASDATRSAAFYAACGGMGVRESARKVSPCTLQPKGYSSL